MFRCSHSGPYSPMQKREAHAIHVAGRNADRSRPADNRASDRRIASRCRSSMALMSPTPHHLVLAPIVFSPPSPRPALWRYGSLALVASCAVRSTIPRWDGRALCHTQRRRIPGSQFLRQSWLGPGSENGGQLNGSLANLAGNSPRVLHVFASPRRAFRRRITCVE